MSDTKHAGKGAHYEGLYPHPERDRAVAQDTHIEFDWKQLAERLGEVGLSETEYERLGDALAILLEWVIFSKNSEMRVIGYRAAALAWIVRPALFSGQSAAQIAAKIGISRSSFCEHTAAMSRRFNYRSHAQSQGYRKKALPVCANPSYN